VDSVHKHQEEITMSKSTTPARRRPLVTAAEWFEGGHRLWYDPDSAQVLTGRAAAKPPTALRVFERIAGSAQRADRDTVWLTMLPGFPDGSYGWAQVDSVLGDELGPRLYVEPIGQGDSDKPRNFRYGSMERADLVAALWAHHGVHRTVVVTFDYTSLALLELLRRQADRSGASSGTVVEAAFMINGGLFADAHSHPVMGTPLLRSPLGALGMRQWQRSSRAFAGSIRRARMYARGYRPTPEELAEMWAAITRRDGAAFAHNAAGFLAEHHRYADRWDLAGIARDLRGAVALYVGGSDQDAYEHRQIPAARRRAPQVEVVTFPGGHLTTSEHPDLLAAQIRRVATRHGVGDVRSGRDAS
jgi:pimeloyl-ACP methyl ester carboxylesterase